MIMLAPQTSSSRLDHQVRIPSSASIGTHEQVSVAAIGPSRIPSQIPVDLPHEHHASRLPAFRPGGGLLPARPSPELAATNVEHPGIGLIVKVISCRRGSSWNLGPEGRSDVLKARNFPDRLQGHRVGRQTGMNDDASPIPLETLRVAKHSHIMAAPVLLLSAERHVPQVRTFVAVVKREKSGIRGELHDVAQRDLSHEREPMPLPALGASLGFRPPRRPAHLGDRQGAGVSRLENHFSRLKRLTLQFNFPSRVVHRSAIHREMKTGFTQRCRVNPDHFLVAGARKTPVRRLSSSTPRILPSTPRRLKSPTLSSKRLPSAAVAAFIGNQEDRSSVSRRWGQSALPRRGRSGVVKGRGRARPRTAVLGIDRTRSDGRAASGPRQGSRRRTVRALDSSAFLFTPILALRGGKGRCFPSRQSPPP